MSFILSTMLALIMLVIQATEAANILIYPFGPGFTSHLLSFRHMGTILAQHGHTVTFLTNSELEVHFKDYPQFTIQSFPTPEGAYNAQDQDFIRPLLHEDSLANNLEFMWKYVTVHEVYCKALLESFILQKLKFAQDTQGLRFDLLIVDLDDLCGNLVSLYLNISTVPIAITGLLVRSEFPPNLPSFMPVSQIDYSDQMDFWQRLDNAIRLWVQYHIIGVYMIRPFDKLMGRYKIAPGLSWTDAYKQSLIMPLCSHDIDFPRPLMPNVVCIGGLHIVPTKPLPQQLETFINKEGSEGFVVVSLGTLVHDMEKAQLLSDVLAEFPETQFVWKFKGTPPQNVPPNTRLMEWIPQNDLLGHARIKAAVSNCGIHGTLELVHHSVPVIAIPTLMDQYNHASALVNKLKMGVKLNVRTMDKTSLHHAFSEILYNETYAQNAKKASRLYHDQPMPVHDKFLFYIDYVMKHQGAPNLVSHSNNMTWVQYYSVDVAMFLLMVLIIFMALFYLVLKCIFHILRGLFTGSSFKSKEA